MKHYWRFVVNKLLLIILTSLVNYLLMSAIAENYVTVLITSFSLTALEIVFASFNLFVFKRKIKSLKVKVITIPSINFKLPLIVSKLGYQQILVNIGSVVIPAFISTILIILLTYGSPIMMLTIFILVMLLSLVAYSAVKVNIRNGVEGSILLIPMVFSLILSLFKFYISFNEIISLAYVTSFFAVLIGFDILNLNELKTNEGYVIIGGLGIHDALFIIPLVTVTLIFITNFVL